MGAAAAATAPSPADIETAAHRAMAATGARGLAVALIDDGHVGSVQAFGARDDRDTPLTPDSVMYAASLSKPLFAALVLRLVEERRLDFDRPIAATLARPLPDYGNQPRAQGNWGDLAGDDRWRAITPRMALTHSTGFANFFFLEPDQKLRIHFTPGSRYAYSGEGLLLLQFQLEQALGLDVAAAADTRLFRPLGLTRTSFLWRDDDMAPAAGGWADDGSYRAASPKKKVRVPGSVYTTPAEMARLAAALVSGTLVSPASLRAMTRPWLPITTASQFPTLQPELPRAARVPHLAAGLGVVTFRGPQGRGFFKGGHDDRTANMLVCLERGRRCVLLMANDVRAERAFPMLVRAALGETGWPWRWEYGPDFSPAGEVPPRS